MKLEVTLTFSGGLTKKQRTSLMYHFTAQLIRHIDVAGIVPDDIAQYTKHIKVTDTEDGNSMEHEFV